MTTTSPLELAEFHVKNAQARVKRLTELVEYLRVRGYEAQGAKRLLSEASAFLDLAREHLLRIQAAQSDYPQTQAASDSDSPFGQR